MDQESQSYWRRFNGTVRYRPKADICGITYLDALRLRVDSSSIPHREEKLVSRLSFRDQFK